MAKDGIRETVDIRSNRTFMELKWTGQYDNVLPAISSNRTFMELK